MSNGKQRWPKGPFPEKYKWEPVEARLAGAWDDPRRQDAIAALERAGWRAHEGHDDPYLRVLVQDGAVDLAAARATIAGAPLYAFRWRGPERALPEALGLVASADPVDAVVAVGVAGPRHGVGTAALVRFLVSLRSYARYDLDELSEDRLSMTIVPRDEEIAEMIGERVLNVCPPRARAGQSAEDVAREMRETGRLTLDLA